MNNKIQESTSEKENLLLGILNTSLSGLQVFKSVYDSHNSIVDFEWILLNDAVLKTWNKVRADVLGKTLLTVFPGVRKDGLFELYVRAAKGETLKFKQYYKYDGLNMWFNLNALPFQDGFILSSEDISKEVEADEALKKNNAELEGRVKRRTAALEKQKEDIFSVFMQAPAMIAITIGPDLRYELANPLYLKIVGKTNDIIGKTVLEVFPELKGQPILDILFNVYKTGERFIGNETLVKLDVNNDGIAEDVYFNFVYEPYLDLNGKVVGILNHAVDVTEQVLAKIKLQQSEEKFKTVINNAPLVMWAVDSKGVYTFSEGKALEALGIESGALVGKSHYELYHDFPEAIEPIRRALRGETIRMTPEFHGRYYETYYSPLKDLKESIIGAVAISTDITGLKTFENELRESEEKFRVMADNIPNLAWMANAEGWIFWYNKRWYEYTGTTPAQMEGWGWQSVHDPIELPRVLQEWKDILANGKPHDMVFPLKGGDGEFRPFLTRVAPVRDSQGNIVKWLGTNTDITEQKNIEQLTKESEHRYRTLIEEATVATALYIGRELKIQFVNEIMIRYWGKDNSIIGKSLSQALPELEGQPFLGLLDEVYTTGIPYVGVEEKADLLVDGKLQSFFFNFTYKPLRNKEGEIYGIHQMAINVTDQVLARRALQESEARFRTMAEGTDILIATSDETSNATYFNKAWADLTGKNSDELINFGWANLIHEEDRGLFVDTYMNAFKKQQPWSGEFRIINKHGEYRWLMATGPVRFGPDGAFAGYISSCVDITERKQAEKDLEIKNAQLLLINNDLDNFIYTASHDLKAPISNLEGLLNDLTENNEFSADQKPLMEMMFQSIERFKITIKDLTEISKVQRLDDEDLQTLYFTEILREVILDSRELVESKNPSIETDFKIEEINYSRKNLRSIIYNLLSNSLKYSSSDRKPKIKFSTEKNNDFILLKVSDNGLGLSKTHQSKIFGMFKRAHQHVEGSGVGLYMIKRMIENAGGKIEVESEIGTGSTFIVYFKN